MTENENETDTENRDRVRREKLRDLVSILAMVAGLAGIGVSLVHYGAWLAMVLVSCLVLRLGLAGALRPDPGASEVTEHIIEIRHTDATQE